MKSVKLAILGAALLGSISSYSQTADEVVDKHIEAIGGKDNWRKVKSVVSEGVISFQGIDINVTVTAVHNTGSRQDLTIMGQNNYVIMTPTEGWMYMPVQGKTTVEPMTEEQVKKGVDELDTQGSLVDYKEKGHTIEYLGKEDVEGTECHKVKMVLKGGKETSYFIDPSSYLLIKSTSKQSVNGQEFELTTSYSNYQKLPEGISIPMTVNIPLGGPGMNADMVLSKVEINKTVAPETFKPAK